MAQPEQDPWDRYDVPLELRQPLPPPVKQPALWEEWHVDDDDPPLYSYEDVLEVVSERGGSLLLCPACHG